MAREYVSARDDVGAQTPEQSLLGLSVEVDDYVSAEDYVKGLLHSIILVHEVESLETDELSQCRCDLDELLSAVLAPQEILLAQGHGDWLNPLLLVDRARGLLEYLR